MTLSQFNREVLGTNESDVMAGMDLVLKPSSKPSARPSRAQTVAAPIDHDLLADKVAQRLNKAQPAQTTVQQLDTKAIVDSIRKEIAPMVAGSRASGIIKPQDSDPVVAVIPQSSGFKTTGTIGEERSSTMSDLDSLFELTVPDRK